VTEFALTIVLAFLAGCWHRGLYTVPDEIDRYGPPRFIMLGDDPQPSAPSGACWYRITSSTEPGELAMRRITPEAAFLCDAVEKNRALGLIGSPLRAAWRKPIIVEVSI